MTHSNKKGEGQGIKFLRDLIGHEGDDCVIWPLFRDPKRGYGVVGYMGRPRKAHRMMCELAHGQAPSFDHECAHSCGNGHLGCVNPKHLSWKTRPENQQDRQMHGTAGNGGFGRGRRLTPAAVLEIRSDTTSTNTALAERFDVSRSAIRKIKIGEIWTDLYGSPERDAIVGILKSAGRPMHKNEIGPSANLKSPVSGMLTKLVRDGFVARVGRGMYEAKQS